MQLPGRPGKWALPDAIFCGALRSSPSRRFSLALRLQGCRVSCEMAHDLPDKALGCILLSYPLHPPGKEGQLRDSPLTDLQLPLLFVRGTKDDFSQQGQWEAVMQRMQSPRLEVSCSDGLCKRCRRVASFFFFFFVVPQGAYCMTILLHASTAGAFARHACSVQQGD